MHGVTNSGINQNIEKNEWAFHKTHQKQNTKRKPKQKIRVCMGRLAQKARGCVLAFASAPLSFLPNLPFRQ